MNKKAFAKTLLLAFFTFSAPQFSLPEALAQDDMKSVGEEQIEEKEDLRSMQDEINSVKKDMNDAMQQMSNVQAQMSGAKAQAESKEIHLTAKESTWEAGSGLTVTGLTYNDKSPGPIIQVNEGQSLRVVLQNAMSAPTSLYFDGLTLPAALNGLPRQNSGIVRPGESFAFQFKVAKPGTYWYHPQIIDGNQKMRGLYGAIVVNAITHPDIFNKQVVLVLGKFSGRLVSKPGQAPQAVTVYTVNGKSAPSIRPLVVHPGERVRLRVLNVTGEVCPLSLSGHHFEVVSINGSDAGEPHVLRDSIALNPFDRVDLEFQADNPGVWALASELPAQASCQGKFPGGIAIVVKYEEE